MLAGNELRKPEIWKQADAAIKAATAFVLAAGYLLYQAGWLPAAITDETAGLIAVGLVNVVLGISTYWTFATSKRVGVVTDDAANPESWPAVPDGRFIGMRRAELPPLNGRLPGVAGTDFFAGDDPGLDDFNQRNPGGN